ncbi:MAG: GAF domain-containing protein [Chloroflexota bacterium]
MSDLSPTRPSDATLSVTRAARLLGVHPNTIRTWSDQGRLRYYRINRRGDRRYRVSDLERFLLATSAGPIDGGGISTATARTGRVGGTSEPTSGAALRSPVAAERRVLDLRVLADLAALVAEDRDLDQALSRAVSVVRDAYGLRLAAIWQLHGEILVPRAVDGAAGLAELPAGLGTMGRALATGRAVLAREPSVGDSWLPVLPELRTEAAVPIRGHAAEPAWGVLLTGADEPGHLDEGVLELLEAVARQLAVIVRAARLLDDAARQLHRAEALRRIAGDITSKLDLDQILSGLVDHALVLFDADRAAVFLGGAGDQPRVAVSRGLSDSYLAAVADATTSSLSAAAVAAHRPAFSIGYRDDPVLGPLRAAVVQEGFDTICAAPLFDGSELLGLLNVYHDRPHVWSNDELDTISALADQASIAIKTARNYAQMATWAAQLQSIQQLGARLNRLTSVREIGLAIATELRQLIDYHNVRVYRIMGGDLVPVAMRGQVGEYVDETPEQLRVAVGEGLTGWVARHGVAQNVPDAAHDPRARTVPGTEPDLDESMLLAPMVFEDRVLGVLVLSKLGLNQFSADDLRLLVIYASFAAQAMANADATELLHAQSAALERQVRSQRELLGITESILGTLEPRAVLDQIADRLGALVRYDNFSIRILDRAGGTLRSLAAKGVHAADFLRPLALSQPSLATWVLEHNEPQLVLDELADPRVRHFEALGPIDGSLIAVPLRGRDGVTGVLTVERLGRSDRFTTEEFELVQLFAAHVSIALQNAEIHSAVAVRARTDDLTGLLNHGTFEARLAEAVAAGTPFSLVMLDLDDFKAVNDRLGHQAGDRFLHEVARALVRAGRDTDQVFRYGGDEFALLLPATDGHGALVVAERVREAVRAVGLAGSEWAQRGLLVSCSIGLATYPSDGAKPEEVLLAADRACFVAKRSGRDQIVTAADKRSFTGEWSLQEPTPVDLPSVEPAR